MPAHSVLGYFRGGTRMCTSWHLAAHSNQGELRAPSVRLQPAQPGAHRAHHDRGRRVRWRCTHLAQAGAHPLALAPLRLHRHQLPGREPRGRQYRCEHPDRDRDPGRRRARWHDRDLERQLLVDHGIVRLRHQHHDRRAEGAARDQPHQDPAAGWRRSPGPDLQLQ